MSASTKSVCDCHAEVMKNKQRQRITADNQMREVKTKSTEFLKRSSVFIGKADRSACVREHRERGDADFFEKSVCKPCKRNKKLGKRTKEKR